jgi:hypothetical protein
MGRPSHSRELPFRSWSRSHRPWEVMLLRPSRFLHGLLVCSYTVQYAAPGSDLGLVGLHRGLRCRPPPPVSSQKSRMPIPYEAPGCQEAHESCERNLIHFCSADDAAVWNGELASFPCAGADDACLHQTLIEAPSPSKRRLQRDHGDVPCGLETYQCPHTVLFKGVAER